MGEDLTPQCTEAMCALFWSRLPKSRRKKWEGRLAHGLSLKRQWQLTRAMTEFFARQGGEMEDIARAKHAEFKKQLADCEAEVQRCEQALGGLRASREQLRGAVEGLERVFKASGQGKGTEPLLKLVEPPKEPEKAPETPTDPGLA